jgi:hypothetical protein
MLTSWTYSEKALEEPLRAQGVFVGADDNQGAARQEVWPRDHGFLGSEVAPTTSHVPNAAMS